MSRVNIEKIVHGMCDSIKAQMISRGYRASNELRNAAMEVLAHGGSGRVYRVPNTRRRYRASAPGEVPAVRTGTFRRSWMPSTTVSGGGAFTVTSEIRNETRTDGGKYLLGEILEEGTPGGQMAPRPHQDKIQDKAKPRVTKIYREPYF